MLTFTVEQASFNLKGKENTYDTRSVFIAT
jgi:hypothetical protein